MFRFFESIEFRSVAASHALSKTFIQNTTAGLLAELCIFFFSFGLELPSGHSFCIITQLSHEDLLESVAAGGGQSCSLYAGRAWRRIDPKLC